MKFNSREDIIQLTPLWTGERFPDGRPRVSDDILRRMAKVRTGKPGLFYGKKATRGSSKAIGRS